MSQNANRKIIKLQFWHILSVDVFYLKKLAFLSGHFCRQFVDGKSQSEPCHAICNTVKVYVENCRSGKAGT